MKLLQIEILLESKQKKNVMSEISLLSLARADLRSVGVDVSNCSFFYKKRSWHFHCHISEVLTQLLKENHC